MRYTIENKLDLAYALEALSMRMPSMSPALAEAIEVAIQAISPNVYPLVAERIDPSVLMNLDGPDWSGVWDVQTDSFV